MGGKGSLTIGRIAGLPVRLHFTLLIILPYLAWVIARTTPLLAEPAGIDPAALALPPLLLGGLLGIALFGCVLLHEFAHIGAGSLGGARFNGVTLMLVGGVSEVSELPKRPSLEAVMALAGPAASALIALVCYLAFLAVDMADVRFGFFYLAYVNFALALFNMLPAFPMDGGRVLRAVLSVLTTRLKATRIAAAVGQLVAVLFLIGGLFSFNWVLLLIGVLVIGGARAELEMVKATTPLEGLRVENVMQLAPPPIGPKEFVAHLLERMELELKTTFFVVEDGKLLGVVNTADVRRAGDPEGFVRVEEVMQREVPVLSPEEDLVHASRTMRQSGHSVLPVVRGGELLGALPFSAIAAVIRARQPERKGLRRLREREAT